jgi:hypothetical protein
MREDLIYIGNYQRIYKRVVREAEKRDNDRYVIESVNKTKVMWHLVNREIGKAPENEQNFELRIGSKLISNPTEITDNLNTYLISTVEELVKQNNIGNVYNLKIQQCSISYLFIL